MMLLLEFYKRYYEPKLLPHGTFDTKRLYVSVIAQFSKFLGRDALLADLDPDTLAKLVTSWKSRLAKATVKKRFQILETLWRRAADMGFAENAPPDRRCPVLPPGEHCHGPATPNTPITAYFLTYSPTRLANSNHRVKWVYRLVIRHFDAFLGRKATLRDLSGKTMEAFAESHRLAGFEERTVLRRTGYLIAIWRHAGDCGIVDCAPADRRLLRRPGPIRDPEQFSGPVTSNTPLLAYFLHFYLPLRLIGCAKSTQYRYRVVLRNYSRFLGRSATLADLEDDQITRFLGWTLSKGRSPETANSSRCHLMALWNYAARKRHVEQFPEIKRVPTYKRAPVAWTPEEFGKIINAAGKAGKEFMWRHTGGIRPTLWWPAFLLTIYDTGLRLGAALQLRCSDFNPATRRLFVRAETQKQRCDQVLFVDHATAELLGELIAATPRETLFPWRGDVATICRHFRRILKAAGLPHGRRDLFHKIRRTTATLCEIHVGPGSATKQLGHSNTRVTEKYLDPAQLPETDITAKIPRPVAVIEGVA